MQVVEGRNKPLTYDSAAAQHYRDFEESSDNGARFASKTEEKQVQSFKPSSDKSALTISEDAFDEMEDSFLDLKHAKSEKVAQPDRRELQNQAGVPAFLAAHIA